MTPARPSCSSTSEPSLAAGNLSPYSWPNSGRDRRSAASPPPASGFLLLQDLAAFIHATLQVEVVRAAQFPGILVLGIGRLLQRVCRAAHATPRRRCFSTGNGHVGVL